jgi:hypothetical protein
VGVELTEVEVDVADLYARGHTAANLHVLIPRDPREYWMVAHAPIDIHQSVAWGPVRDGEYVYIPVIPYRTHHDANKAIKYAITLGYRAGLDTQKFNNRDIKRLYLVTGTITEDLAESEGILAFRFYLGFAVQLQ